MKHVYYHLCTLCDLILLEMSDGVRIGSNCEVVGDAVGKGRDCEALEAVLGEGRVRPLAESG